MRSQFLIYTHLPNHSFYLPSVWSFLLCLSVDATSKDELFWLRLVLIYCYMIGLTPLTTYIIHVTSTINILGTFWQVLHSWIIQGLVMVCRSGQPGALPYKLLVTFFLLGWFNEDVYCVKPTTIWKNLKGEYKKSMSFIPQDILVKSVAVPGQLEKKLVMNSGAHIEFQIKSNVICTPFHISSK